MEATPLNNSVVRVNHRQRTAWRIAGRHGWAVDAGQIQIGSNRTSGIEDFAATGSDDDLGLLLLADLLDPLDFSQRAFAAELMHGIGDPGLSQRAFPGFGQQSNR